MNPQKKPRRKDARERRLFLHATTDAMSPYVAAIVATTSGREIRCVGTSDPSRNLQAVVCRLRPIQAPSSPAGDRNPTEGEALAVCCRVEPRGPASDDTPATAEVGGPAAGARPR